MASCLLAALDTVERRGIRSARRMLDKSQWVSKADLQRLQLKKLKALLVHAYDRTPFYHMLFRKAGFRPKDLKCLEDVQKIPTLKKAILRRRFADFLARDYPREKFVMRETSGTTAAPMRFYRCRSDVGWGVAAELRGYGWAGYEVGHKIGIIWQIHQRQRRNLQMRFRRFFGRTQALNALTISESSMREFAAKMQRWKPDFIRGYVASTNLFAAFLTQNKEFRIQPKAVFTTAETLQPHYRRNIEEAFNCDVFDYYAASEMSHVAFECQQHEGLHVADENILLEIIRDGEQVAVGEEGQVLLTNLHNYAMPFIRYEIDDLGTQLSDDCPCGRRLTLIKPVGRHYEVFAGSEGQFTYLKDAQFVLQNLPIQDFQIIQESLDEIVVRIAKKPGYTDAHSDFIVEHLRCHGPARIRVEIVDSIVPGDTGKIQHIVSKIQTDLVKTANGSVSV